MSDTALKEYIQPYPGIRDFIFVPPETGVFRTWIYRASEDPQTVLDFHLSSLLTQGWKVTESGAPLIAQRAGSSISVNASRRQDETRIVYEVQRG